MTTPKSLRDSATRRLARSMRTTAVLELVNIPLFWWVAFVALDRPYAPANLIGFGLTSGLLITGARYWQLKARQVERGVGLDPAVGGLRLVAAAAVPLLIIGGVAMAADIALSGVWDRLPGILLYALAWGEYVNYFRRQLVRRPPGRGWRNLPESHLRRDLRRLTVRDQEAVGQ